MTFGTPSESFSIRAFDRWWQAVYGGWMSYYVFYQEHENDDRWMKSVWKASELREVIFAHRNPWPSGFRPSTGVVTVCKRGDDGYDVQLHMVSASAWVHYPTCFVIGSYHAFVEKLMSAHRLTGMARFTPDPAHPHDLIDVWIGPTVVDQAPTDPNWRNQWPYERKLEEKEFSASMSAPNPRELRWTLGARPGKASASIFGWMTVRSVRCLSSSSSRSKKSQRD